MKHNGINKAYIEADQLSQSTASSQGLERKKGVSHAANSAFDSWSSEVTPSLLQLMVPMSMVTDDCASEAQPREYAQWLLSRVRSFHHDPLHSAAYLGHLAGFLHKPHQRPRTTRRPGQHCYQPESVLQHERRIFVYEYAVKTETDSGIKPVPKLTTFDDVDLYKHTLCDNAYNVGCNELVFMTGCPSAEWLSAVGARYQLDARFFHQHLCFLPTGQRDWFTNPCLPSRSRDVLRLCIPSIVFLGEHRYVDMTGLQKARGESERRLQQSFRSLHEGIPAKAGRSIVRRMNIHNGDSLVIEQEASCCLLKRGEHWTVLIWSDSGQDDNLDFLPAPTTDQFNGAADRLEFCPVFFEKDLLEKPCASHTPERSQRTRPNQPLSSLPENYGVTVDWTKAALDPVLAIQELLTFHAASELQYLNMLEQSISNQISQAKSLKAKIDISFILHFDYAKSVLIRHDAHIHDLIYWLQKGPSSWRSDPLQSQPRGGDSVSELEADFAYLLTRVRNAIALCETGRETIKSNASIEETKQAREQAELVTKLTKATNRLTFIFLPISFVTAAFGMNFKQLGQGDLSIWLWVWITLPLLAACIALVEMGSYLKKALMDHVKRLQKET